MISIHENKEGMILLVGDSIIDNHYWHNPQVGRGCTGDVLRARAKPYDIRVMNHAVEETQANDWYMEAPAASTWRRFGAGLVVNPDAGKRPDPRYTSAARENEVQSVYPRETDTSRVRFFPKVPMHQHRRLTVFVSAIGNDLFLNGEWLTLVFAPTVLVDRLDGIFKAYHHAYPGCRVVYIFPYKPVAINGIRVASGVLGWMLDRVIDTMKCRLMDLESLDDMIDLSTEFHYGIHHATSPCGIPEPTRAGASHLAELMLRSALAATRRQAT